jgi:hypothetical protein
MADDNSVVISFGASTDAALAGIAQIRNALAGLTEPVRGLGGSLDELGGALSAALPVDKIAKSTAGMAEFGAAARGAAIQARGISDEIKALHEGAAEQKVLLAAEVNQFQITQDQKFALLEAETQKEYAAELALLQQQAGLAGQSLRGRQQVMDRIALLKEKHDADMVRLDEQSIAAQQAMWSGYLSSVTGAFNSQLRGLLEGTTSWHKAMIKMLEDLTIKFIEGVEQMVVKWAAGELAKTTASTTGAAAREEAEQTASSAGILANAGNALQAIMTDAAQAFAGVFAFLAPTMGPAAAGPAAAAQASVSAAAIFDVGTDYVVRGGLALIHPGETIIPAARGAGPYTGAGATASGGSGDVHFHVAAMDSQSVARFFNDNAHHVMKAVNRAIKNGSHLNLRTA